MSETENGFLFYIFMAGMVVGLTVGYFWFDIAFRRRAIENNAAYYDAKTGDFMWNNEKPR
jgi:hypothetical protein